MNETQKNIRAYKRALPELKERVIAVALLLLMSAAMMTSATFAWITLSRAPEVSDVTTTVAANGNLEIALVEPGGSEPAESAVGDSSAALGQTIVKANLTWGNLVNLSDESYGLNNIVLRPALLGNANDLVSQPLKGVDYSADGRLQEYFNEDYQFANWTILDDGNGFFKYNMTPQYGVRAISSIKYEYKNNTYFGYTQIRNRASGIRDNVIAGYDEITGNKTYINSLAGLMGDFMTDQLNDSDTDVSAYIKDLYNMLYRVYGLMAGSADREYCFEDALAELANAQVYMNYRGTEEYKQHLYTKETLMAATSEELKADGVSLSSLASYKTLKTNVEKLLYGTNPDTNDCLYDYYRVVYPNLIEGTDQVDESYDSGKAVKRSEVMPYIDLMVNIASTQITCEGETNTVAELTASKSKAASLLGKQVDGVITKGYLKDFEQLTGGRLDARNVKVSAFYMIQVDITAKTIRTSAAEPYAFTKDLTDADTAAAADKGDYTGVAKDTYGMAVDLWVRTNAADSYLVLEGNVLTETEIVRATDIDKNGNEVELSTVTITSKYTDESGTEQTMTEDLTVYILVEDGKEAIYRADAHALVYKEGDELPEGQTISEPKPLMTENVKIIGYEGENRIWNSEEDIFLNTDSTTQGSGSCYVFYAEDPAQQENGLRLLSNLRVAFVDNNESSPTRGKLVALARLDTDNPYEENGKVTIPLVLMDDGSANLTKTESDELAILRMKQNVPTKLLTLIYLDGREVSNAEVLAANEIHGQLNVQLGSTAILTPIDDEELEAATRTISASIKKTNDSSYGDNENPITFDYDKATEPMTVNVKVVVEGDNPANASAFFMRKVNATQGSREENFVLQRSQTEEGVYYGTYTFTSPGNYILRTVMLDGIDYSLPADDDPATDKEYPRVEISGFGIDSVSLTYDGVAVTEPVKTIMVSEKLVNADLSLSFSTDQNKLPRSVQLQFAKDDGTQVTAIMAYDASGTWHGTATFTSSGEYTLKYVILDGEYTELDPMDQKVLDISMGLKVRITDEPGSLRDKLWDGTPYSIPMYVEIFNDADEKVPHLTGVKLNYGVGKSVIDAMDPDVKWDAVRNRYAGNILISGPGIYNFISVTVGGNELKATIETPPKYNCTSPNPPAYHDAQPMEGMDYILDKNLDNITVGVRLEEAQAAMVTAIFQNAEDGQEYRSEQVTQFGAATFEDGVPISEFKFKIPKTNKTPGQTGDWTIKRLELVNVFANDKMYLEGDPLIMHLTHDPAKNDLHVKVAGLKVGIKTADEVREYTGSFMESKDTAALTITVTDHKDRVLEVPLSDITLQYQLKKDSWVEKGGYKAAHLDDLNGAGETDTYTLKNSDGKTYTQSAMKLIYAGVYEPYNMTFTVDGEKITYTAAQMKDMGMPTYTLTTDQPTVSIKGRTTYGDSSTNGNTVTVYFDHTTEKSCGITYHNYKHTSVTLGLLGIGKASSATLNFAESTGATVQLYTQKDSNGETLNRVDNYSWSADGDCLRWVGYLNQVTGNDQITPAGTLTANQLILTDSSNQTYTFTIATITIINIKPN